MTSGQYAYESWRRLNSYEAVPWELLGTAQRLIWEEVANAVLRRDGRTLRKGPT